MTDDSKPYGLRPEVEAAWNFPLFEALTGRRSRRFGFGMELTHGPFVYKSPKEPYPLSENETAMLVAAATGVTVRVVGLPLVWVGLHNLPGSGCWKLGEKRHVLAGSMVGPLANPDMQIMSTDFQAYSLNHASRGHPPPPEPLE